MYQVEERNRSIDIARGIILFFIVWGHCLCPIRYQIYTFHVPAFVIFSGMFFTPKLPLKDYLKKKCNKLILPYLIFYIYGVICDVVYKLLMNYHFTNSDLIRYIRIWNTDVNGPIWFLLSLFWINITSFFLFKYCNKKIVIVFVNIGFALASIYISKNKVSLPFNLSQSILLFNFFYLGYILKTKLLLFKRNIVTVSLILFIIACILCFNNQYRTDIAELLIPSNYLAYLIFALNGTYLSIQACKQISKYKISNMFIYFSTIGIGILGLHGPFVSPLYRFYFNISYIFTSWGILNYPARIIYSIMTLFIVFGVTIIIYKYIFKTILDKITLQFFQK